MKIVPPIPLCFKEVFLWRITGLVLFSVFGLKGEIIYQAFSGRQKELSTLTAAHSETGPSGVTTFQTGERAGDGVARLPRKRVPQPLQFLFEVKVQQPTHKPAVSASEPFL